MNGNRSFFPSRLKYSPCNRDSGLDMKKTVVVIGIIILFSCYIPVMDVVSIHDLDGYDEPIGDHSRNISLDPDWGPPGEGVLDIEGEVLYVPFFQYKGGDFALAAKSPGSTTPKIILTSSSEDRTLIAPIFLGKGLLRSSGEMDLILRDSSGNIYGVLLDHDIDPPIALGPSSLIYTGIVGRIALGDVTGDDIDDILHLDPDGNTMEFFEGPHPSAQGRAELNLPLAMDEIISGMDLTGDGISEIILWVNEDDNSTLMIYHGLTLTPLAVLNYGRNIFGISHGDIDGSGIDDLFMITSDGHPDPGMVVLFGEDLDFDTDISLEGLEITWNGTFTMGMEDLLALRDINGDGKDDLMIGSPFYDGGKGMFTVRYGGGRFWERSNSTREFMPDASYLGEDIHDSLGKGLLIVDDHDGDLLPDIFLNSGVGLKQLEMPENILPFAIQTARFTFEGGSTERITAQEGDRVDILCTAAGGNLGERDIIKAQVRTARTEKPTSSWVFLIEDGNSSGNYRGTLMLRSASVPGRSLGVVQNDIVKLSVLGLNGTDLLVKGVNGQQDPPYFIRGETEIEMMEDSDLDTLLTFIDPDGDVIELSQSMAPVWLSFEGPRSVGGTIQYRMYGMPDNGYVGWNNFTVTATSGGWGSDVQISIYVKNRVPIIKTGTTPRKIEEGSVYKAVFELDETGGNIVRELSSSGPSEIDWLDISDNGIVSGVPENRHVGNWTFNLTLDDGNGGIDWYLWDVEVINMAPDLIMPEINSCMEKVPLELDFNTLYEGDGLTGYVISISSSTEAVINSDGILELVPDITSTKVLMIDVWVTDGNGASTNATLKLDIINSPAKLLNPDILPDLLIAGTEYSFDLESDEEGEMEGSIPRFHYSFSPDPIIGPDGDRNTDGSISIRPWNLDAGNHSISIELQDWNDPEPAAYIWNFTVIEGSDFKDPYVEIHVKGRKGSKLVVDLEYGGGLPFSRIGVSVTDGISNFGTGSMFDLEKGGPVEVEVSLFSGPVIVYANCTINNTQHSTRSLSSNISIDLRSVDRIEEANGISPMLLSLIILILIIMIAFVILSLFLERTSFPIQSALFKGGNVKEEQVLAIIQDRPGIGFRELSGEKGISRKDLIATIDHLERKGMARAVIDGHMVRFLPMMGAFVEGPLALNRYQERILNIILKGGRLTINEISEASGYSMRKVEREMKMLELKGSLTIKNTENGPQYYLNRRQRMRVQRDR